MTEGRCISIIERLKQGSELKSTLSQFNVPGWNTYVREKHDVARDALLFLGGLW